jgi:GNAT superfamily N-acetyltransferase
LRTRSRGTTDIASGNLCELISPSDDASWAAYHRIRRTILFERRGMFGVYDPNHPEDRAPGHLFFPKILAHRGEYIGTVRIDLADDIAYLRRVAIDEPWQRQGFGRELIRLAEAFARDGGARRVESDVAVDAVAFYAKCGYQVLAPSRPEAPNVHMGKVLEP